MVKPVPRLEIRAAALGANHPVRRMAAPSCAPIRFAGFERWYSKRSVFPDVITSLAVIEDPGERCLTEIAMVWSKSDEAEADTTRDGALSWKMMRCCPIVITSASWS